MRQIRLAAIFAFVLAAAPGVAIGQGAEVSFGLFSQDTSLPVEVLSDRLSVNQADGAAIFSGNVVVTQGEMRLSAAEVRVVYGPEGSDGPRRIATLEATGGVLLVSGQDAAEAAEASYSVDGGVIVLTGNVLLTQGQSVLSGEKLTVNLSDGTGLMEGRVRTVLQPAKQ